MPAALSPTHALRLLARSHGLQTAFTDGRGRRRHASREAVLATLRALGAPVEKPEDAIGALAERRLAMCDRPVEPVAVLWEGRGDVVVRLPASTRWAGVRCRLRPERGKTTTIMNASVTGRTKVNGVSYITRRLALPAPLTLGYYTLTVDLGEHRFRTLVVSAPHRVFGDDERAWGCFLPMHALCSKRSWGVGDFSDMEAVFRWLDTQDGRVFSTLPLLAGFLGDAPFEPSPYLPASRLFWNEVFVDPRRLPEFTDCAAARRLVDSSVFQREINTLQSASLVDYQRVMTAKRQVLELLADSVARKRGRRHAELRRWIQDRPLVEQYATFRANGEHHGTADSIRAVASKHSAVRYHRYAQWVAANQLNDVATRAAARGQSLYLDLPLGVHPRGFDVWRYPSLFARDAAMGAPPDELFANGQDWTAPPCRPDAAREDGYAYLRASLAHQLPTAGTLRLDHVMGLHRVYWIPQGCDPTDGVYVHQPADELYAILGVESHRHRTRIVGENLGTVPRYVNRTMNRHGVGQLFVTQFAVDVHARPPLRPVPARAVACVNTHDTPTFQGFLDGADIDERVTRGVLGIGEATDARRGRRAACAALQQLPAFDDTDVATGPVAALPLLKRCLAQLCRSRANLVVINLEDLWLETSPQNVPGTTWDRPNWRRRARYRLETFTTRRGIRAVLGLVASQLTRHADPR